MIDESTNQESEVKLVPIYEYHCEECGEEFEKLVLSPSPASEVECPRCGGKQVKKAVVLFGTKSSSSDSPSAGTCVPTG